MTIEWASITIGAFLTVIFYSIRDSLKTPTLKYDKISGPWKIEKIAENNRTDQFYDAYAYRLRVINKKEKLHFNVAAENCVCWVNFEGAEETFQIPWIGEGTSKFAPVDINIEDYRELDFCARKIKTGQIVAPSLQGYVIPITLGDGTNQIKGHFRVTSKNGRKEERKFTIVPIEDYKLNIKID